MEKFKKIFDHLSKKNGGGEIEEPAKESHHLNGFSTSVPIYEDTSISNFPTSNLSQSTPMLSSGANGKKIDENNNNETARSSLEESSPLTFLRNIIPKFSTDKPKPKILMVFPNFIQDIYGWAYSGKKFIPEMERKEIDDHIGSRVVLIHLTNPTMKSIADICKSECPEMVIFYTHGLPNDILLSDGLRCSSDRLLTVFEFVKRNCATFNPTIILGSCFSAPMAKFLNDRLKLPVMGFDGELSPFVLTKFIIHVVLTFVENTTPEVIFERGLLGIKKESSEFKEYEQHSQARLYQTESMIGAWLGLLNDYISKQQLSPVDSVIKIGFFRRAFSPYHSCIDNHTAQLFILTIKVTGEPIQLLFIQPKAMVKVFTGQQNYGFYSLFSENPGENIYNVHFSDRNIQSGSVVNIYDRHLSPIHQTSFIPECELSQHDMKKIREKETLLLGH